MKNKNLEVLKKKKDISPNCFVETEVYNILKHISTYQKQFEYFFFFHVFLSNQDFSKIILVLWNIVFLVELHIPTE